MATMTKEQAFKLARLIVRGVWLIRSIWNVDKSQDMLEIETADFLMTVDGVMNDID